ncbi:hypothetical protein JMJ35_008224 [Cladonia borealis]|uniref:VPS37 C-terminal domain-containing protein n=1 Tax=Cladonia borealis TaxID=184061 RepID=A0AA39QVA3_9LECA|nr:hypothetical protein JMJ35_008224 [Cladonia borealis]
MASSDLASLSNYQNSPFNPSSPPPPPPKSSHPASANQTPSHSTYPTTSGPPLPPPPPQTLPPTQIPSQSQEKPLNPPPPDPSEHWLPEVLLDKTSQQLEPIFTSPPLLHALSSTHPSLNPSPLPPHLHTTSLLATHVQTTHTTLLSLRAHTQSHLLHLHALERQWRYKQAHMDRVLAPWSAKMLYQKLKEKEREGEEWCKGLEESWVEGEGGREGRGRVWRRREARERWDEGRVGGWR